MPLPDVPPWSEIEQLNFEKETLGLYWSGHPIDRYADDLRDYGAKTTRDLNVKRETIEVGRRGSPTRPRSRRRRRRPLPPRVPPRPVAEDVSIGGIVSGLRPLKTRKGDRMCVFMLDDAERQHRGGRVPGGVQAVRPPGGERHDGAASRAVREGRRVGADPGVGDRADRDGARAAGEVGRDQRVDAAARPSDVREAAATSSPSTKATAAWRSCIHEQERHIRVTADVSGIRVRPSERLVSDVEKICGAGLR